MSFDADDDFTHLADEEDRRRRRKGTSAPLVRVAVGVLVFVAVIAVLGFAVQNMLHSREVSSYEDYLAAITQIAKESDASGQQLNNLLTKPGDATRKDVQTVLDRHIQTSKSLEQQAKDVKVPEDLKTAHQWFLAVMQLRAQGFQDLKPSLLNALEVQDLELASEQISGAMQLLLTSDIVYDRIFTRETSDVLKTKEIPGLVVPASTFLTDQTLATKGKVANILSSLKSSESLQSVHGVALIKLTAMPSEKQLEGGATYNLQSTDKLAFAVTVENQGNMTEKDIPVTLRLSSETAAQPQIVTVKIDQLKPKETKMVTVTGVNPAAYGENALLRVEVGPVPSEKNKENNILETHVVFVL